MASDSIFVNCSKDEESEWVIQIGRLLQRDDLETVVEYPASIFKLPDCIRDANPDAFVPCRIALGPHHHLRLQFYNMQPYKLYMAQKAKEEFQLIDDFSQLHDRVAPLELIIRACYADHLNIDGETLTWMMLVDALFLLRVLQNFPIENHFNFLPLREFDDLNLFNGQDGKLVAQFQIVSDALKLENQIPILVLKKILPSVQQRMRSFLFNFSVSVFPIFSYCPPENEHDAIRAIFDQSHHLLHFMYLSILTFPVTAHMQGGGGPPTPPPISFLMKCFGALGYVLNIAFIQQLSEAIGLIRELVELLWMVKTQSSSSAHQTTPPPLIPSASQLQKLNVEFKPMISPGSLVGRANVRPSFRNKKPHTGILDIKFKIMKGSPSLSFPIFVIKDFSETLLENLLAFEAMADINPPVLAQYVGFMKALVRTPKDVDILKEELILQDTHHYSDEEVVKFFNRLGSSISTRDVNKPILQSLNLLNTYYTDPQPNEDDTADSQPNYEDVYAEIKDKYEKGFKRAIEETNKYYDSFRRDKAKRFVKKYANYVLKIILVFFIISLIILVIARLVIECVKPIFG